MLNVGFLKSDKQNEKRRAILPEDIKNIKNIKNIFIEKGYGEVLGIKDEEYIKFGVKIEKREEILKKDIICDPKIGEGKYLDELKENQIIFGWIHAVQNYNITQKILDKKLTAIAWEDMFEENRHIFWKNNEIAGEAAILHAFQQYGKFPENLNVALIGRGNVARGAKKILDKLGANVVVYDRNSEILLKKELTKYDVIVNAILWDTTRKDHIINKSDLKKMKKNSMIIDISCDKNGGIESSYPTTFEQPIYIEEGIIHYVVDHTPTIFFKNSTESISLEVSKYLDKLVENKFCKVLKKALIINTGEIKDLRISKFQNR